MRIPPKFKGFTRSGFTWCLVSFTPIEIKMSLYVTWNKTDWWHLCDICWPKGAYRKFLVLLFLCFHINHGIYPPHCTTYVRTSNLSSHCKAVLQVWSATLKTCLTRIWSIWTSFLSHVWLLYSHKTQVANDKPYNFIWPCRNIHCFLCSAASFCTLNGTIAKILHYTHFNRRLQSTTQHH